MATRYTPEQQRVIKTILKVAKQKKASPKEAKAAIETGLVESNLTNPSSGDADSAGWRQERASLYANPTDVAAAAGRFFDEARQANSSGRYGSAGSLAAAVQRPAAQYRGRYQQQSGAAQSLLAGYSGGAPAPVAQAPVTTMTSPGVDNSQARKLAVISYLQQGGVKNASATAALPGIYNPLADVAPTTTTVPGQQPSPSTRPSAKGSVSYAPGANRAGVDLTPGIKKLLGQLAATAGPIKVGTGTNHSEMTTSGNVSDHWEGNASDIPATGSRLTTLGQDALKTYALGKTVQWLRNDGQVENVKVTAANARRLAASGGIFNVPYGSKRRIQVIANTQQGGDHTNHLHVGVTAK